MKLSAKVEYACLAIIALARQDQDESPVRARVIAEGNGIPEKYLVQILLQLKAANLVRSTRGSLGGYRLARPAQTISLLEVIHAIEGPDQSPREEQNLASRVLAAVLDRIRSAERRVLAQTSMAQLADLSSPHDWVI
ncbi:transcriptional regulator, BadM/Rrf2 family [Singulisphaera sp. GP187]|uniref:RrF2 family transcriptional regulator n=1 Tax=Singulisphaera sp. GP187 TaxID=1882752 RepID=UPI0009290FA3|nr:Rrf2 family transcriptional regulator [Singulisphaera sp. GP187]SIO27955.1 transcriptional regulator, BadM/Rrf2 family [Singulisphaera sp. GP187]